MEANQSKKYQLGLLGGGQLARMLLLKAHEMGLSTAVLCENESDPAAQVTRHWVQGSPFKKQDLAAFIDQVETVSFESEFVDADLLKEVGGDDHELFAPSLENLKNLQNRWTQKQLFESYGLETAKFIEFRPELSFEDLCAQLGSGSAVIKKSFGGYDGYGTFVIRNDDHLKTFVEKDFDSSLHYIAEAFIPFKRELAMTFARSQSGDVVHFPLVESFQEESRCLWVKGPISHKKVPGFVKSVTSMLNRMNYVGVIAFELFENRNDQLIVNETAPRVHNSSHYSLNGFNIDQFSLHLNAVLGKKLNSPKTGWGGFAMHNLIGSGVDQRALDTQLDVQLHWYAKIENRDGRKMGHMNTQGINPEAALERLKKARKEMKI